MIKSKVMRNQCQHSCSSPLTWEVGERQIPLWAVPLTTAGLNKRKKKILQPTEEIVTCSRDRKVQSGATSQTFSTGSICTCWGPALHTHLTCALFYGYLFTCILLNLSAAFHTAYHALLLKTHFSSEICGTTSALCSWACRPLLHDVPYCVLILFHNSKCWSSP